MSRGVRALGAGIALLLAACGGGAGRTVPANVDLPSAPPGALVGGIYTGAPHDQSCCFAGREATFRVVKREPATDLGLKFYIPDAKVYRREPQGFTVTIDNRYTIARCCFRAGLHTILFPLPPALRDARAPLQIALRMRETFVPKEDGMSRTDDRRVSVVFVGARFMSY